MRAMATDSQQHTLHRSFGLLQATAMNMSNMIGVGPFLTIPIILKTAGGPQALLGWLLGALLALCDGMIWAELASAIPSSGGTLEYLKVAYARTSLGRLLPFLFIWQFLLSGPLEIASGSIGFAQYLTYLAPMEPVCMKCVAALVSVVGIVLLYRKIESVGKLMVALWIGVIVTMAAVLVPGVWHFNADAAFDFPPDAFTFSQGFVLGLGSVMLFAMYDFFGYYSVCNIGDEVRAPSRTIPRSILLSVVIVAAIYLTMQSTFISVVPWREAMNSEFIGSLVMERLYGDRAAVVVTVLICWTAFASVFALMLSYSRIPYAAARDGFFFSAFARLHPRGDFPHVSLLVLGGVTVVASFFPLDAVISALFTTRILVQFIAQIGAVVLLRRGWVARAAGVSQEPGVDSLGLAPAAEPGAPDRAAGPSTFRMALYPLPAVIALVGWLFGFACAGIWYILAGVATLLAGIIAYAVWRSIER
jgi:basic amino acid/polyamine antiporter, APA family